MSTHVSACLCMRGQCTEEGARGTRRSIMLLRFEEVNLHTFLACHCLKVAKLSCLETPHGHGHLLHTRVRRQGCLDAAAKLTTQAEAEQRQRSSNAAAEQQTLSSSSSSSWASSASHSDNSARKSASSLLGSAGYKNERIDD